MNAKRKSLKFETANVTRDELAQFLLNTATKVKLVNRKMKDFASHPQFSVTYNKEELTELLYVTIAKVINAHEAFILKKKGLPVPENFPCISDELDLSTFGNIVGYMRSAYDNNISKDYKKHIATKRTAHVTSYDSAQQDDSNDSKQGNAILNLLFEESIANRDDNKEYSRLIKEIFSFLKDYDKKINRMTSKKGELREEKKSRLAYLFLYLLDPKYKGKFIYIKEKFPSWTQYIYKKNKDELSNIIKRHFSEDMSFLFDYLNTQNESVGESQLPKHTPNYYDQSCDVSSCFNFVFKGDKVSVELSAIMFRLNNGRKEVLDTYSMNLTVSKSDIDLAKEELTIKMAKKLTEFKKEAEKRRHNSLKEIYGKAA